VFLAHAGCALTVTCGGHRLERAVRAGVESCLLAGESVPRTEHKLQSDQSAGPYLVKILILNRVLLVMHM